MTIKEHYEMLKNELRKQNSSHGWDGTKLALPLECTSIDEVMAYRELIVEDIITKECDDRSKKVLEDMMRTLSAAERHCREHLG